MYEVAPLVQMKLPSANEVMLRINDVALRANGQKLFAFRNLIQLIFDLKYVIIEPNRRNFLL